MTASPPPRQHLLIFDCETYFDKEYSLKKMPTPSYILDPRFELQMVAVKLDDGPHHVISGPEFPKFLSGIEPALTTTVSFNSLFDNSILAWRYGWTPRRMIDAMGMARALLGHELRNLSLAEVARYLGLGEKGNALHNVMGMRLQQIIDGGLYDALAQYAVQDNHLCEQIFLQLYERFPYSEVEIMDMVLRCCVEPKFKCNAGLLEQHLVDVQAAKLKMLQDANMIDRTIIMSTPKFKEALEARGVEVEMKVSPTTGKETPAFAKTDEFMELLQDHEDPVVAAMAAARIGLKSTLEETRTAKFIEIAKLNWPSWIEGNMPLPLRYGGAHTHRLSGEWKMNPQNMPTVRGSKGKSKLRLSLEVAEDEVVVTCDLSQIEARLVAWICGCGQLVREFALKQDPYSLLAQVIFSNPNINRKIKIEQPDGSFLEPYMIEGFIGKTGILGLGYGAGKDAFDTMVIRSARSMGIDLTGKYDRNIGDKAVEAYRRRYKQIPSTWYELNNVVATHWLSASAGFLQFGPCQIGYGEVKLPSGLSLKYASPGTRMNMEEGVTDYVYRYGNKWHRLYGAKLLENIVQALARIVVMNASLRIKHRAARELGINLRYSLQAHDELVFVVKRKHLDDSKKLIHEEMVRRPSWAPDAPIDAELGVGRSYGEAK